jgi:hypothetical protein
MITTSKNENVSSQWKHETYGYACTHENVHHMSKIQGWNSTDSIPWFVIVGQMHSGEPSQKINHHCFYFHPRYIIKKNVLKISSIVKL